MYGFAGVKYELCGGKGFTSVYIDDLDLVLENLLGCKVEVGTITTGENTSSDSFDYCLKTLSEQLIRYIDQGDYGIALNVLKNIELIKKIK